MYSIQVINLYYLFYVLDFSVLIFFLWLRADMHSNKIMDRSRGSLKDVFWLLEHVALILECNFLEKLGYTINLILTFSVLRQNIFQTK